MSNIQRVAGGLVQLLGINEAFTPSRLLDEVRGTVDLTQLMGLAQPPEHVSSIQATAVEGAGVTIVVPEREWWILYGFCLDYMKTATMTLFVGSVAISPALTQGPIMRLADGPKPLQSFASTAGTNRGPAVQWQPSGQPWLLSPGTTLWGAVDILGTDANVDIELIARISRLT